MVKMSSYFFIFGFQAKIKPYFCSKEANFDSSFKVGTFFYLYGTKCYFESQLITFLPISSQEYISAIYFCSVWLRLQLNTKIGFTHHPPTTISQELFYRLYLIRRPNLKNKHLYPLTTPPTTFNPSPWGRETENLSNLNTFDLSLVLNLKGTLSLQ